MKMRQNRKGLSSVVGAIFMVLIMIGALNAYLYATEQQGRLFNALTGESTSSQNRLNEKIEISSIGVVGNRLNMTVSNTGGQVANIKTLYIVNETSSQQYRYDINKVVDNRKSESNIGQSSSITTITSGAKYSVRVVTASGNSASATVASPSSTKWPMALYVIPPTPTPNSNVTLLFAITNNSTESFLPGVTPILSPEPSASTSCTPTCASLVKKVEPPSNVPIARGTTALFKWTYYISASDGTRVTFTATMQSAQAGNSVTETVRLKNPDAAQQSSVVLTATFAQRPSIFLTVPSPVGDNVNATNKSAWSVSVVNPTSAPMTISRIVITGFSVHGASQKIFDPVGANCDITAVYPATGWSCLSDSQFEWKNIASAVSIPAFTAKSFRVFVEPGSLGGGVSEPAYTLAVTVYSSMGQFTQVGYATSMSVTVAPLFNVHLTNGTSTAEALDTSRFIADVSTPSVTNKTYTFALVDREFQTTGATKGSTQYIKSGGKLIVNVPESFTKIRLLNTTAFSSVTNETFDTGVTQFTAVLGSNLGDTDTREAMLFKFQAESPSVSENKVYVMFVLFDGLTNVDFPATAFAQIPISVAPP